MKNKKIITGIFAFCLVFALGGCSSSESSSQNTGDSESQTTEGTAVLGEVSEISDNSLTIAVGTEKEMEEGQQTPPDSKPESGEAPSDSEGEAAEDTTEGEARAASEKIPQGEAPDGEEPSMLDLTGEELTISINENTVITKESGRGFAGEAEENEAEEASLSDISEGTTISVTYDEDSMTATSITIRSMGFGGQGGGKPSEETTQDTDTSESSDTSGI